MRVTTSLVTENEFFSATRENNILVVRSKPHFSRHISDLKKIDTFFDHLEIIARTDKVKVVVFLGTEAGTDARDTMEFFQALMGARREDYLLQRLFNMVNNYVVTLAGLNKVTIHANTGKISMFYFNMSLSCDYRIVGEGSTFENVFAMLGTIPKGGGGYYLSRLLGAGRAAEVLQWPRFSAEEALNLGIVDKIVPADKLEETALATAALYQEQQVSTLLDVRRLLKSDVDELRRSLETEDMLILNRVNSPEFRKVIEPQLQAFKTGK